MYTIYESELATLENNSKQLLENNEKKERLLTEQKEQLGKANALIEKLKESNEQTENSLKRIKKSYDEYEKEAEKKIKIKTRQRNMWILISAGLGYWALR
jgi:predicted transcriptional regulator